MEERSAGNNERASFFLPMAIAAYRQAGPLDADGLYHLSLLEAAAGQHAESRATAERILATAPNHLLGLGAAAEAAAESGDSAAAAAFYRRFLQAYDDEIARSLPEYRDHARGIPAYLDAAQRLVPR
jgi:hypothetical protein